MWSGYFPGANVVATTSAIETLNLILENGMNSEDIESDEMIGNSSLCKTVRYSYRKS